MESSWIYFEQILFGKKSADHLYFDINHRIKAVIILTAWFVDFDTRLNRLGVTSFLLRKATSYSDIYTKLFHIQYGAVITRPIFTLQIITKDTP